MQTRVYKLFANVSANTSAAASVIIQQNGLITAILGLARQSAAMADLDAIIGELSFASAIQTTTSDTVGPICEVQHGFGMVTSGGSPTTSSVAVMGIGIPVVSGDRLYLNIAISGTVTGTIAFYVYVAS